MGKSKKMILLGFIIIIVGLAIYTLGFTAVGRMVTIQSRGFNQVRRHVYVDKHFTHSTKDILSIVDQAEKRVEKFWGKLDSNPTIIISDNDQTLHKLGWDGRPAQTTTYVCMGAHNYVIIAPNGVNVDVVAHELTHAELHERLYKGKLVAIQSYVPVWFDEGVATQNDYRSQYNDDAWKKATKNGMEKINFAKVESGFASADINTRRLSYTLSKHELKNWMMEHQISGLVKLANEVCDGKKFSDAYGK